jgi:dihydrodipicolinate synthase/N-acetylneuraminate lyase
MTEKTHYSGVIIPMITPFTNAGAIDIAAVERIVEHIVSHKTHPFILGTTGESASVPEKYRADFVKTMVNTTARRAVTYAGISGNCLDTAIRSANTYFDLGVDAVVAHPPGYFPLNDEQIIFYYEELLAHIDGPLVLYNIPPVTNLSLSLNVVEELSHHPLVVAFKDSEQSHERQTQSLKLWRHRDDFSYLTGWAATSAETVLNGGAGMVPSAGNLFPGVFYDLYQAAYAGEREKALKLQTDADNIGNAYQTGFILSEALVALKIMMHELGFCTAEVLPPLKVLNGEKEAIVIKRFLELKNIYQPITLS